MLNFKLWRGFALVATVALVLAACGSPASSSGGGGPIKVGVIGPYIGGSADMGVAMNKGIVLAAKEFNAKGGVDGRKVELVPYDDGGDAQKAVTGAQALIDRDNVTAILGSPNSGTAIATVKVANARRVPQFAMAQSPEVMAGNPKYSFRVTPTNPMDITVLIQYMKAQGWHKIGLLNDTSAYGLSGLEIIKKAAPASGLELTGIESYEVGAPNLTPQALKLRDSGAQAVLMWSLGADGGRFAQNVKALKWDVPLVGGRGLLYAIFGQIGGPAVEGTVATAGYDAQKKEAVAFTKAFEAEFHTTDSIEFAVRGYDDARLLFQAMTAAGPKASDREALRNAIEGVKDFKLVQGAPGATVSFAADKHENTDNRSVVLVKFTSGGWKTAK